MRGPPKIYNSSWVHLSQEVSTPLLRVLIRTFNTISVRSRDHEARPLPLVAPFRVHPKIAKSYKAHSKADNSSWTHVLVLTRANDDLSTVVYK